MRRAVERHGAAVVELPPGAILGLWTAGDGADAIRAVRAAEELRESLAPLGEGLGLRAGLELVEVPDAAALLTGGLAPAAELAAAAGWGGIQVGEAARAAIGREAIFDDDHPALLLNGSRGVPAPVAPPPGGGEPALSFNDGEPPPADLPEAADERIAVLFNARAWEHLRAQFLEGWRQVDHRAAHTEQGWTAEDLVGAWRTIAAEATDARAVVQRRSLDGPVTYGVLRISGHRGGRPFETAHALLTLSTEDGIEQSEVFALGDRRAARQRFDELRGAPPEPPPKPSREEFAAGGLVGEAPSAAATSGADAPSADAPRAAGSAAAAPSAADPAPAGAPRIPPAEIEEEPPPARERPRAAAPPRDPVPPRDRVSVVDWWSRHEAQLARWCAWFDAHDVDALVGEGTTKGFVQVDHRAGDERNREEFRAATASSLEMVPDLRVEAELIAVEGNRRVAKLTYTGEDVLLTTFVLGVMEGERLGRAEIFEDAGDAQEALAYVPA